jgi:hypothetical protein
MHRDLHFRPEHFDWCLVDLTRVAKFCCISCRAGPYFFFLDNRQAKCPPGKYCNGLFVVKRERERYLDFDK